MTLRLGTRASALARWQAEWTSARLREAGVGVELFFVTTRGDRQQTASIESIGGQGVFTKELQRALLEGRIDLAVHSLKDLPTDEVPGLALGAVPKRGPVGDCLACRRATTLDDLPQSARIGTGSPRRRAQLWHERPDLQMLDARGNVDTRLRKLDEGHYDALVLAEAGLHRLGLADRVTQALSKAIMLPAPGQGALGIEVRAGDTDVLEQVRVLDHPATHFAVRAERSLLAALQGGCLAPVAAWGRLATDRLLHLTAVVLSADGRQRLEASVAGDPHDAVLLGESAANELLARGAAALISAARTGG